MNQDTNKDGIADQIELKFTVNTDGSKIRNIAIIQSIVYSIDSKISADIKSFLVNSFTTTNGLSKLVAQGQINLVQKENFALGRVEREIGFGPENDLA